MRYKLFGKSGLRVSELCLGTMTFGEEWGWGASKEESRKIFDAFAEAGGNFIDTANHYTNGTSEKYVGEFVRGMRDRFVIATKYTLSKDPQDPNSGGNHRKCMMQSVEGSLKRLGTDYLDIYWVHAWDELTPYEEVMRALDDLVRQGKILHVGASNVPAWLVAHSNAVADLRGWSRFNGLQLEYNLVERSAEREFLNLAAILNLTITAWSPLASGFLTGKYAPGAGQGESRRLDKVQFISMNGGKAKVIDVLRSVAEEIRRSPAQTALAWARKRSIPILGARTFGQIQDNLRSIEFELSDGQMSRLDGASAIDYGYPLAFIHQPFVHQLIHGETYEKILC